MHWLDDFLQSFKGVTRDYKEEWGWIRYMVGEKMFAALLKLDKEGSRLSDAVTIKLDVLEGEFLRKQYKDIIPGYYMNKQHWNTVYLDGKEVTEELIKDLIEKSYKLVLSGLSKKMQNEISNL
ncbi:MAG: MmcQ/YjbR family DNA-binding protein [Lachnospiraceae bacterium]|nr:MmcQ/YjbR family DNA-binding protein [Lachnospiraceae bacterium]